MGLAPGARAWAPGVGYDRRARRGLETPVANASPPRLRIVGIGRCTKGLHHELTSGDAIVLGRHRDCTVAITRTLADEDGALVSRHHVVIDSDAGLGWCVYDNSSANGTRLLKRGVPPAILLEPGERHPVGPDDVIELAGSHEYQFVCQLADVTHVDSGETLRLHGLPSTGNRASDVRRLSDLLLGADHVTIGTAPDNVCRLVDPSVSRHHAVVSRRGSDLWIRDVGSTNGTAVDGILVTSDRRLAEGSMVRFGRLGFVVDAGCSLSTALPSVSLDVRLVDVTVEIAGKPRLRSVTLGINAGEMIGVLGPSACGKSTLLKAVAGQQPLAGGAVYINGRAIGSSDQRARWLASLLGFRGDTHDIGFVHQIDLLPPELTVHEILTFAARQMGLTAHRAGERVARAIGVCNLEPLRHRVVQLGDGQLNLSGGQLKRVCVALEVLREPRILVLDEPTTGQDPKNTDDLTRLFRALTQDGVTVLMSTHDLRNLALFDKVVALCLGYLVYYGPATSFAAHFGKASADEVYASLPDRDDRLPEAASLAAAFRRTPLWTELCDPAP